MTLELIGSTIIMLIGVTSIWLIGYRRWRRLGWKIGLVNQFIWVIYASLTGQWGFLPGAVFAGSGFVNALWRHEEQPDELLTACKELIAAMGQLGAGDHPAVVAALAATRGA